MEIKINPKRIFSNYITVSELLQSLPVKALKEILNCRVREFLPSGKILFRQGDLEQDIFILVAGRLQFTREEDGKVLARGEFQKSDLLGELSIFTGEPRSATVTAIRDSELIRIPSALAKDILYRNPNALLQITKIISKRLAGSKGQKLLQIKPASCFSIFSCDEKDYLSAFLDTLQIIMQEFGESKIIHKSDFENAFDPNVKMKKSEKEHAILLWFQELESKYDYIFFVGEYKDTDWSKRCIRQSDRVLLYQDTSFENSKSLSETNILQNEKHLKSVDLILKHSDETLIPKKTINYLQNRNISR